MANLLFLLVLIPVAITLLMCWQESRRRKVHFLAALLICVVTSPLIGYFLIIGLFPLRNPKGCRWCGNKYNEAEYCGICFKNDEGLTRAEANAKA